MHAAPGRTLSRDDRPQTARKLTLYCRPRDCEPQGEQCPWAPHPHPHAPRPAPLPSKACRSVSTCVSSDKSFPGVRQEPALGLWKGTPFLQHSDSEAWLPLPLAPGWEAGTSDGAPEPCKAAVVGPVETWKAPGCRLSWRQWLQSSAMTLWVQGQRSLQKSRGAWWGGGRPA